MSRRGKIHTRLLKTTSKIKELKLKEELVRIERDLQESYRRKSTEDEANAVKAIKRNSKYFFLYAKKFNKVKAKVGPLLNNANQYVADSPRANPLFSIQLWNMFHRTNAEMPRTNNHIEGWHLRFQGNMSFFAPYFLEIPRCP